MNLTILLLYLQGLGVVLVVTFATCYIALRRNASNHKNLALTQESGSPAARHPGTLWA
jgi:hypothetical protein